MGDPFPRSWLVSQVEVIGQDRAATARLAADDFDLRQAAVVARPLSQPLSEVGGSTAIVDRLNPRGLTATVETTGTQLLVLSQVYYPGWQANIDGRPAELLRVNVVQSGVVVPAGRHTVEVTFRPQIFRWGSTVSLLGLLACAIILAAGKAARLRLTGAARSARQDAFPAAERITDF